MPEETPSGFSSLPDPAIYLPFSDGRYSVKPNLFRLGFDFGNQDMDGKILQIDCQFGAYRKLKIAARKVAIDQYYREDRQQTKVWHGPINKILCDVLVSEYPQYFMIEAVQEGWQLRCGLSQEILAFNNQNSFLPEATNHTNKLPEYRSGLDALACQIQEDICILSVGHENDKLIAAHLCYPNRWSVAEKIGRNFAGIHQPVAGFNRANPRPGSLISAMLNGGPYVRFAWGLSNDAELNHHPSMIPDIRFDNDGDPLYVRIERQVMYGLPDLGIILFFIRTYYQDCYELRDNPSNNKSLSNALRSMSKDALDYKNLVQCRDRIVSWLASA